MARSKVSVCAICLITDMILLLSIFYQCAFWVTLYVLTSHIDVMAWKRVPHLWPFADLEAIYWTHTQSSNQPQNIHLVSMTESRRQWLSGLITPRLSNMPAREHRLRVTQIWNPIAFFTNMFVWKYCMMLCQIGFIEIGLGAQIRPTSFIIKLYNVVFLFGADERIERICRCLPYPQSSSLEKLQRPGCRLIFYMLHYRWKIQDMDLQRTNDFNIHVRTSW